MSVRTHLTLLALGLVVLGGDALAQSTASSESASAAAATPAAAVATSAATLDRSGPRLDARQVGVRSQAAMETSSLATALPQPAISRKRGVAQMVIGGVALVGGAIVGGDAGTIVMLAGLGYGIYGLYLYLQ